MDHEVKDIHDFPTSFLAHLERTQKEKDCRLIKVYDTNDDGILKKFSYKKDITRDQYYNIYYGDVAKMVLKLPKKEYTLLIANIPYGFRMVGSSIGHTIWLSHEPFLLKWLAKMVKDFAELTTTSLWRIVMFHSMDQGYFVAQTLRS